MNTTPKQEATGEIHRRVRAAYGRAAQAATPATQAQADRAARAVGYDVEAVDAVGVDANLGIGCGNPHALAQLQPGEVVVDLGSGAGFDALIAAPKLGASGRFIGVDMTPAMLERARTNAVKAGHARTVEFREGLIEALPVATASVDVVISNCVINLSPDKPRVFEEIFRVLKPGGRIAISDIALERELPRELRDSGEAYDACLGGAILWETYREIIEAAGFVDLSHTRVSAACLLDSCGNDPLSQSLIASVSPDVLRTAMGSVYSYGIRARKP